jgi:peptide deformylase
MSIHTHSSEKVMTVRIRVLGDPVLKERARPVMEFDEKLERLADQMIALMDEESGIGLAATQVGVLSRVIVWRDPEDEGQARVFVNPVITQISESCSAEVEGCLSVPGASVEVMRADEVVVSAMDLQGESFEASLVGYPARIVQHEVDHLEGTLILDRATPDERRRVLKELREQELAREARVSRSPAHRCSRPWFCGSWWNSVGSPGW